MKIKILFTLWRVLYILLFFLEGCGCVAVCAGDGGVVNNIDDGPLRSTNTDSGELRLVKRLRKNSPKLQTRTDNQKPQKNFLPN